MRVNNAPDVPWIQNFDMFCKARYLMIKEHLTAVYDDQILLLVANFQLSILGRNIEMASFCGIIGDTLERRAGDWNRRIENDKRYSKTHSGEQRKRQ